MEAEGALQNVARFVGRSMEVQRCARGARRCDKLHQGAGAVGLCVDEPQPVTGERRSGERDGLALTRQDYGASIMKCHEIASLLRRPLASCCCGPCASVSMRLREMWRMMRMMQIA